jgi:hypothetical protein
MTLRAHHRVMMTQQLPFSILSAPLAAIDRRALSQAWYSALHLTQSGLSPNRASRVPVCHPERSEARSKEAPGAFRTANPPSGFIGRPHRKASTTTRVDRDTAERRVRSALARKIEAALLDPSRRCERATFTIEGTGARVHVALRTAGGRARLVAICPPSARTRVARALEEARYALAARGIELGFETKEACHDR